MSKLVFDETKGGTRIRYEMRTASGDLITSGETGGKTAWVLDSTYGVQNVVSRVKSAMDMMRRTKTVSHDGDGDICRSLEDGRTLHIWIDGWATRVKARDEHIAALGRSVDALATAVADDTMTPDGAMWAARALIAERAEAILRDRLGLG